MKNTIIAALGAYIFYGFCEVRHFMIPVTVFLIFFVLLCEIDEEIECFSSQVRCGQRLNKRIDEMKGVRF